MNLRDIKKDIDYVLSAFVEDCSVVATVNPKASDESIAALMEESINLYNELRDKVNAKNVEGTKKAYFAALRKEVLEKTDALYEKLSAAVKAAAEAPAEKPSAKKPAAKKAPAKKVEEKPAAEAPAAEKPAAKKPAAKKAPAKKAPAKEAEEKPAAEKKAPAKKPAAKKAPAKKAE